MKNALQKYTVAAMVDSSDWATYKQGVFNGCKTSG